MSSSITNNQYDYRVAIELNNIGVYLIEAKAYRRAMKTLKEAVKAMNESVVKRRLLEDSSENDYVVSNSDVIARDDRLKNARRRLKKYNFDKSSTGAHTYTSENGLQEQYLQRQRQQQQNRYSKNLRHNNSNETSSCSLREQNFCSSRSSQHKDNNSGAEPILIESLVLQEEGSRCEVDVESAIMFYNLALAHLCVYGRVESNSVFINGEIELLQMADNIAVPMSRSSLMIDMTVHHIQRIMNQPRLTLAIRILNNLVQLQEATGQHSEASDSLFRLQRLRHAVQDMGMVPNHVEEILSAAAAA